MMSAGASRIFIIRARLRGSAAVEGVIGLSIGLGVVACLLGLEHSFKKLSLMGVFDSGQESCERISQRRRDFVGLKIHSMNPRCRPWVDSRKL